MEGYIYRKEFTWLGDLPGIYAIKDTIDKNEIIVQNGTVVLNVTQTLFNATKHKIVKRWGKDSVYLGERIDGRKVYGTDGLDGPPVWQIDKLKLTIKGKSITIPENAYNDLFEANLDDFGVSFDKRGNIYMFTMGSDGGEAYNVVWFIKNGKYLYRYIDMSLD